MHLPEFKKLSVLLTLALLLSLVFTVTTCATETVLDQSQELNEVGTVVYLDNYISKLAQIFTAVTPGQFDHVSVYMQNLDSTALPATIETQYVDGSELLNGTVLATSTVDIPPSLSGPGWISGFFITPAGKWNQVRYRND